MGGMYVCGVFEMLISPVCAAPSEVGSLSVIALSNSSIYVEWTRPVQPNGLVTGLLALH